MVSSTSLAYLQQRVEYKLALKTAPNIRLTLQIAEEVAALVIDNGYVLLDGSRLNPAADDHKAKIEEDIEC